MEIWEDINGYNGLYQVSSLGNIKSFWYGKEKTLKPGKDGKGYLMVYLSNKINKKMMLVHRIVGTTFIKNDYNKPQINHKNGIKTDNRLENLEWVTASENTQHAFKIGLNVNSGHKGKFGKYHHSSKKINQYNLKGDLIKVWESIKDTEKYHSISLGNISRCCSGNRKTAGGYKWAYYTLN